MHKLKQFIAGTFLSAIFFVTSVAADNKTFHGTVILPTSITDLLGTCGGEECPSINIIVNPNPGSMMSSATVVGSVDYNDMNGKYEYYVDVIGDVSSDGYMVSISISNGNMGNEYLYYSFGTDNDIGTTGDLNTTDIILHPEELWDYDTGEYVLYFLNVSLTQTDIQIDIDLTNKDEGRQKVTGKIKLPSDFTLGSLHDDSGVTVGRNYITLNIHSPNYESQCNVDVAESPNIETGLYTFTGSIKNEQNVDMNLTLELYGNIYTYHINTFYQIGEDALDIDDHSIDGDEKLVTGWSGLSTNYATFSSTIVDFGTIDVDTYLIGSQLLSGTLTSPEGFPIYADENGSASIALSIYSYGNDGWFDSYINFRMLGANESTPSEGPVSANGTYAYEVLIPQDIQENIEDNNLSFSINFNTNDYITDEYSQTYRYYSFGDDQQVGLDDHILEGICIDRNDAKPLSIDFSSTLPVVDINLSDYILPAISKVEVTLRLPESVSYLDIVAHNTSCTEGGNHYSYINNNPDGTNTFQISSLEEMIEYGFEVYYETGSWELGTSEWYDYVLNDDDGDFTNGGSFLDEFVRDEITWAPIFEQTYMATDSDVVFSPFDLILPESASSNLNTAVIMYLLN